MTRRSPPISASRFLSESAYRPLPTLVKADRELFNSGQLRTIHRARAATDPAVEEISRIIHDAAANRSRRLVLLAGIPGAGKTLVGLRIAHAHFWMTFLCPGLMENQQRQLYSSQVMDHWLMYCSMSCETLAVVAKRSFEE